VGTQIHRFFLSGIKDKYMQKKKDIAEIKTPAKISYHTVYASRIKPLNSPPVLAFSVFCNKWHAFYKIALPVYLRQYLWKDDLKLNAQE